MRASARDPPLGPCWRSQAYGSRLGVSSRHTHTQTKPQHTAIYMGKVRYLGRGRTRCQSRIDWRVCRGICPSVTIGRPADHQALLHVGAFTRAHDRKWRHRAPRCLSSRARSLLRGLNMAIGRQTRTAVLARHSAAVLAWLEPGRSSTCDASPRLSGSRLLVATHAQESHPRPLHHSDEHAPLSELKSRVALRAHG